MPKLSCSAKNCANNNNDYCCISSIKVSGNNAVNSDETCCNSFRDKSDSFTNCATEPNLSVDIACKAKNCVHNNNDKCMAESINISGQSACSCTQTECTSFACNY